MDYRFLNVIVAALSAMNIAMVIYLTNYIMVKVPFDMDIIRAEYVEETKYLMRISCLYGVDFREGQVEWGGPYPVDYCNEFIDGKDGYLYENVKNLGLKKRYRR